MSDNLSEIIKNQKYLDATLAIAKAINIPFEDDDSLFIKEICQATFLASGCTQQVLLSCMHNDFEKIVAFSIKKWNYLEQSGDEQDFSEGEEVDDSDDLINASPIGPAFLIGYLCEFCLIKYKNEEALVAYLNKLRVPGQKKYLKSLVQIFNELSNKS